MKQLAAAISAVLATSVLAVPCAMAQETTAGPNRAILEEKVPGFKVRAVQPAPVPGLFEVVDELGRLIYVDSGTRVAILGNMIELATGSNLTQQSLGSLLRVDFDSLPLDLAIKRVRGTGARRIAVFSDPDCPYCRQLEHELETVDDVTVYLFLYPVTALHPEAAETARRIWCAADPATAWDDWMMNGRKPESVSVDCTAPIDRIAQAARDAWVTGTPGLVFESGRTLSSLLDAGELEAYLAEDAAASPNP